ncbi:MAG TPA: hypothetical protein PKA54_09595 [Chitinophagaceae bacterium]|nr:MAG: tRNA anti-like protein [Bacteroidetes bacterium OLB11]HMN33616.1 hypothetical protein [Chitinophagaceae bacterium]
MITKTKLIFYAIGLFIVIALLIFRYTQKSNDDLTFKREYASYQFDQIIKKIDSDTSELLNQIISLDGPVKKITKDSGSITFELGYDSLVSSVICDIDKRHLSDFEQIKQNDIIKVKGMVSAISYDPNSIFGNTLNLTFCVKN